MAIASVGPMSLNIIMPALPGIVAALESNPTTVQLLLSLYLVFMAVAQLVLGALSDRFGRRPVLIGGLILTVAVSLAALLAYSIAALVAARALQAFGASTGIVISRAIIRDLYERDEAAAKLAIVTMVIMVVPTLVPPLGGFLQMTLGWQSIFAAIALFSAIVLVWVWMALPETHTVPTVGGGFVRFLEEFRGLCASRAFNGYVLAGSFSSALFFIFLGGAPHVIATMQGRSAFELGLWLTVAALAYMVGNFFSARYSTKFGVDRMILIGAIIGVAGGIAGLILVLWYPHLGPVIIALPQGITAFANGLVVPNGIAGAKLGAGAGAGDDEVGLLRHRARHLRPQPLRHRLGLLPRHPLQRPGEHHRLAGDRRGGIDRRQAASPSRAAAAPRPPRHCAVRRRTPRSPRPPPRRSPRCCPDRRRLPCRGPRAASRIAARNSSSVP
jgi:MFS transporter, DHA1 family, multidrug resistance protein